MRAELWFAILTYLGLTACQAPQIAMEKRDSQILSRGAIVIERSEPKGADAKVESLYTKFPAMFVVYPENRPTPSNSYYFGVAADSELPYQTVAPYYLAAVPDFGNKIDAPIFQSRYDEEQFLTVWAAEFSKDLAKVKRLEELAESFRWETDPNFIRDEAAPIPPELLANMPSYYKATQKVLARRFTFLAPGYTELKPRLNGNEDSIPLVIQEYTLAQIQAGKTRYNDPDTGCVKCHGKGVFPGFSDPYKKHSSDYLASYNDTDLIRFFRDSSFPSGELFADGQHVNAFATEEDAKAMVAFLRNLSPSFDKIVELSRQNP